MKHKVLYTSQRGYPITAIMLRAAEAQAHDAAADEHQVKTLLYLGLPRSVRDTHVAAATAQIDELAAGRMLEAAVDADIASRAWPTKLWQSILCVTGHHQLNRALSHPDQASAEAARCTLYECPYCERSYVHDHGLGWYDYTPNTRQAEHRDRAKRIAAVQTSSLARPTATDGTMPRAPRRSWWPC